MIMLMKNILKELNCPIGIGGLKGFILELKKACDISLKFLRFSDFDIYKYLLLYIICLNHNVYFDTLLEVRNKTKIYYYIN